MDDYMSKPVLPRQIEACLRRLFQNGAGSNKSTIAAAPAPAEPPWVDRAHFESVLPDLAPAEAAETLTELHTAATEDFCRIQPQLLAACRARDSLRLADLVHGLKGCFLTLGWMRIARRCIEVLGQARKSEFVAWETFPSELDRLYQASTAAMSETIATIARAGSCADKPATAADTDWKAPCLQNPGPASAMPAMPQALFPEN
jgi:hypothetical protein